MGKPLSKAARHCSRRPLPANAAVAADIVWRLLLPRTGHQPATSVANIEVQRIQAWLIRLDVCLANGAAELLILRSDKGTQRPRRTFQTARPGPLSGPVQKSGLSACGTAESFPAKNPRGFSAQIYSNHPASPRR